MVIFKALILLLEGGMTYEKIENFIEAFLNAAKFVLFGGGASGGTGLLHSDLFIVFAIISVGFLTITFYSELVKEATNDTLTPEKMVAALCKLFIGAMMIFFLPEILNAIFGVVEVMFKAATSIKSTLSWDTDSSIKGIDLTVYSSAKTLDTSNGCNLRVALSELKNSNIISKVYEDTSNCDPKEVSLAYTDFTGKGRDFEYYFDDYYEGVHLFNKKMAQWLACIIVHIVSAVALWGCYFAVAKAVIEFAIFAFLSPIGIINVLSDNNRMIGVKYLKKLLAKGLTLAVMVLLIVICSNLCSGMIVNALKSAPTEFMGSDNYENDEDGHVVINSTVNTIDSAGYLKLEISRQNDQLASIFSAGTIGKCLIMQIAMVGLLLGASKLSDELFAS